MTPSKPPVPRAALAAFLLLLAPCIATAQPQPDDDAAKRALANAEIGLPAVPLRADHPLAGWVEYATLRRGIASVTTAQAQAFLQRQGDTPAGALFREAWIAELAKRQDWAGVAAAWTPAVKSTALRCNALDARARTGTTDAAWTKDVQQLWREASKTLPDACNPVFDALARNGGLDDALRWQRFDAAAAEQQTSAMRAAARGLPATDAAIAADYAAFIDAPHARASNWPKTDRSRLVASVGLAKLAKADPAAAESRLPALAQALAFTEADRGRVLYEIALWTVASYGSESARRLAAVPDASYDERLHEWRVREALARSDWRAARAAIAKMGPVQRADAKYAYFDARLAELTGAKDAAPALYRIAAQKPEFHGFLAADRIGAGYPICPWRPADGNAKATVAHDPGLVRALALYRIGRGAWANREWTAALERFDDVQRRNAVAVAQDGGWVDRGVFGLVNVGGERKAEELRLYDLRFPLPAAYEPIIRREAAKQSLDVAWVAAEIRAESIFDANARSPADARGLMQVLPSTGAGVARRLGLAWAGGDSLFQPETNIVLGTAYLRQVKDTYGLPYFAIAAYNAGPAPVGRWRSQRPAMDADFWIETVSYKETRDYVGRVLAFSALYDWKLGGGKDAVRVSDRMLGRTGGARTGFACPAG